MNDSLFIYEHLRDRMKKKSEDDEVISYKVARYVIRKMRISKLYCNKIIQEMIEEGLLVRDNQRRLVINKN